MAMVGYGAMCDRLPFKRLLWLAIAINIAPGFLYLLIGGTAGAIAVSAVVGLVSGIGTVAVAVIVCPARNVGTGRVTARVVSFGAAGGGGGSVKVLPRCSEAHPSTVKRMEAATSRILMLFM